MSLFTKVRNETIGEEYFCRTHESGLTVYVIPKKHSAPSVPP